MQHGRVVEVLDVARLRADDPDHLYTRQLLHASRGYDRQTADTIVNFEA